MATERRSGPTGPGRDSSGKFANDPGKSTGGRYQDSPLSHPGSGGPGDDRQDNSSASSGFDGADSEPESTPATDKHHVAARPTKGRSGSSDDAAEMSESDPE